MERREVFEFDLKMALQGYEVQTKDGRKVTNVVEENPMAYPNAEAAASDDINYEQGLTAIVHNVGGEHKHVFYHDGKAHKYGLKTGSDLVIIKSEFTRKFDLVLALVGEAVQTKDGRKVSMVKEVDPDACMSVEEAVSNNRYVQGLTAKVHNESDVEVYSFYHDGTADKNGVESESDLVMCVK